MTLKMSAQTAQELGAKKRFEATPESIVLPSTFAALLERVERRTIAIIGDDGSVWAWPVEKKLRSRAYL